MPACASPRAGVVIIVGKNCSRVAATSHAHIQGRSIRDEACRFKPSPMAHQADRRRPLPVLRGCVWTSKGSPIGNSLCADFCLPPEIGNLKDGDLRISSGVGRATRARPLRAAAAAEIMSYTGGRLGFFPLSSESIVQICTRGRSLPPASIDSASRAARSMAFVASFIQNASALDARNRVHLTQNGTTAGAERPYRDIAADAAEFGTHSDGATAR
jgi:hypothetical protein